MKAQSYFLISGIVFAAIAIMHLLRLINGWPFVMGSFNVPVAGSVVGMVVAGALGFFGLKLSRK